MSRVIFVTGASRGIGKAICQKFRANGDRVAGCASQESSLAQIEADEAFLCDVTNKDQVRKTVQDIRERMGGLDVVINNAGLSGSNPLGSEDSDEQWNRIMEVNLQGTYYVTKQSLPFLPEKTGRIINVGSVLSLKGVPEASAYCTAKHAVLGFTRALAHDLASKGITVNCICPGWTRTAMAKERLDAIGFDETSIGQHIPVGRMAEPEEVADMAFYLAGASAGTVTGQSFTIDGGYLA